MTAGDKQRTMGKTVNSCLESEQATNACPGNCTRSQSEERTAPQLLSIDYCAESNRLILLNHLGTVTMELTSPNDSWDLEFPCVIFSYYITPQQGKSPSCWLTYSNVIM